MNVLACFLLVGVLCGSTALAQPFTLKGKNGNTADFVAIFDATPESLVVLQAPDASAMWLNWSMLDLEDLKTRHNQIFGAYQKALASGKTQPLGLGLAEGMLSLAQLGDALKQAVQNPYEWPYAYYSPYVYSYRTSTVSSQGEVIVERRVVQVYSSAPRSSGPYYFLKRVRDAQNDREKKELWYAAKNGAYGLELMIERLNSVLDKLPPEKMFKREASHIRLTKETTSFCETIRDMRSAPAITADHQRAIKDYFDMLGIR